MGAIRKLRNLLHAPGRLRRSRGFGIHSPFAFSFVTGVLRERSRYYAYEGIHRLRREAREQGLPCPAPSALKLTLRLLCRFKPATVALLPGDDPIMARWLTTVAPQVTLLPPARAGEAAMILTRGLNDAMIPSITNVLEHEGIVVMLDVSRYDATLAAVRERMKRGMTFSSRFRSIAVGFKHLPRQHFDIYF